MYFALVYTEERDIDDGEIRERHVDIRRHADIKKVAMLGGWKNIKVDKTASSS